MALSSPLNLALSRPPLTGKQVDIRRGLCRQVVPAFRIRCEKSPDSPQPTILSRRDAVLCFSSSLATAFGATSPAEAQTVIPDIRQKIMEKLGNLLEKIGLAKKADSTPATDEKASPASLVMEKIEILKTKVGLSKEEPILASSGEKSPQETQIMEKIESLKEKMGLASGKDQKSRVEKTTLGKGETSSATS